MFKTKNNVIDDIFGKLENKNKKFKENSEGKEMNLLS